MPRLIKLSSDNEVVGDFSNFFQEDIVLEPKSKVALYNLSLTLSQKVFEVNIANYAFQVQVKAIGSGTGGGLKQVLLRLGTYTQGGFLKELTRALNASTALEDGARNGSNRNEWKPIYSLDKLKIQYNATRDDAAIDITFVLGNLAFNGNNLGKAGTNNVWESAYTQKVFNNGVGQMKCKLLGPTVNVNNGVCIGLMNSVDSGNTLSPQNYYISVYVEGGVYKHVFNGNTTTTTRAAGATDDVAIIQELGAFRIMTGANTNTWTELVRFPCEYDQILHGAVSLLLNTNTVGGLEYTPSPYQNTNATGVSLVDDNAQIQDIENYLQFDQVGAAANAGSSHRLLLPAATARLLGYTTLDHTDPSQILGSFNGTEVIRFGKLPETLAIELPSLGLEGYDGEVHRRRPLLAILPAGETPSVQRDYSASYPIFIDLNNKDRQLLNTIQVRILDEGGEPVSIDADPGVVMTILVD